MVYLAAILTISSLFDASEWACPYGWESTWQHLYMAQPVGRITNQMTYANELLHPPALGRVWRLGTVDIPPCFLLPPPLELTLAATAGPSYVGTMRDFGKGETHDDHSRPRKVRKVTTAMASASRERRPTYCIRDSGLYPVSLDDSQ
ncbi:hypothetical protein AAP_01388 [Ascosphaera apis ARSEF 7405]|uniref:Secreted protein n=1 Tax=Ascosphaera apis ARSEF 7405 TaxID=392613 RepID=A0A162IL34_9EURO|nr:hypothetical protein AAP_01388 [Ascosphaera apis ARSEF 7405]